VTTSSTSPKNAGLVMLKPVPQLLEIAKITDLTSNGVTAVMKTSTSDMDYYKETELLFLPQPPPPSPVFHQLLLNAKLSNHAAPVPRPTKKQEKHHKREDTSASKVRLALRNTQATKLLVVDPLRDTSLLLELTNALSITKIMILPPS